MARTPKKPADGLDDLRACTEDFAALMNVAEAKKLADRWSEFRFSVGITLAFGALGRADLVGSLRKLAEADGGEDMVVETIAAVTSLIEQTKQFAELFESIQARLFIATAEMIDGAETDPKQKEAA